MDESEMTEYQKWEHAKLNDIDCDTDRILSKMEGNKMGEGFDMGMLAGLLQNRGIDTAQLAALANNKDGTFGGEGSWLLVLLFLIILGGGNGFGGFGGNNAAAAAGLDANAILNAISTQGIRQEQAVTNLASTLGCSNQAIMTALNSVGQQLAVNHGDFKNAIQSCCCNIQSAIDKCCCQTNLSIERSTNLLNTNLGGAIRELSQQMVTSHNALNQQIQNQTVMMNDKFCALELREKENEIQSLRARILEQSQDAQTKIILNAIENQKMVYDGKIDGTLFSGTGTVS